MVDRKIKYGVNRFIEEVTIESLGEADIIKSPKYKYVVEFAEGESHNGNGHQFMKIYTDGELEILKSGNWKISPILKMPFNWTGFWVNIEISDLDNEIVSIGHKPDNATQPGKKNFLQDIEYVFKSIQELSLIKDKEHFEVIRHIKETTRMVNIVKDVWKEKPIPFRTINEKAEHINESITKYNNIKDRLKPEFVDYMKKNLNNILTTFNGFEVELIE